MANSIKFKNEKYLDSSGIIYNGQTLKNYLDNLILSKVYPVGSIYISITSISPATLFGGTWVQLKDRFLLGVGDTYTSVNTTGGEATVTLTTSQIPSHTHTFTGSSHTHSVGAHSHGLNNHTHTYAKSNTTSGSTVLTIEQIPSHSHNIPTTKESGSAGWALNGNWNSTQGYNCGATGGGKGHTHSISTTSTNTGAASGSTANSTAFNTGSATQGGTNANTGGGGSHNNLPPYLTVYMWKRTA